VTLVQSMEAVGPIAMGCAPLGLVDMGPTDLVQVKRAVEAAFDRGVRTFDTADIYGLGRAETELADALGPKRQEAYIITKFGVRWSQADGGRAKTFRDASPAYAKAALEASLRRLRLDAIPLYLLHWPDSNTQLEDTLAVLDDARTAGKIIDFGLSNFDLKDIEKARSIARISAVQDSYSLIERKRGAQFYEGVRALGLKVLTFGVLGQGLLSGTFDKHRTIPADDRRSRLPQFQPNEWDAHAIVVSCVKAVAKSRGVTPSQVALRWVLDSGLVDVAVVGIKSIAQLEANIGALDWALDQDELRLLDDARATMIGVLEATPATPAP
jgi:aryl-alcohol dehydrogenase-like predicted oxidoreductase